MPNILILFAHPLLERSRVHAALLREAATVSGVTIDDLYQRYPQFDIDVRREQDLLLSHDIIIFQHPFYWYSAPPLLKQWQDVVLEHNWAYGRKGRALEGKKLFNALSSGGGQEAYSAGGFHKYPVHEYLRPFEHTAELCRMQYWPPFWVPGVHRIETELLQAYAKQYRLVLETLSRGLLDEEEIRSYFLLNDIHPITSTEP